MTAIDKQWDEDFQNMVNAYRDDLRHLWHAEVWGVDPDWYEDGDEDEEPEVTMYSYFVDDALDFTALKDHRGDFYGTDILLACGGPTVRVKTTERRGVLEIHWGNDSATLDLPIRVADGINEIAEAYFG